MCEGNGGGRGIRTPKGLAARWISSPLPCQLRLALRASRIAHFLCALMFVQPRRVGRGLLPGYFSAGSAGTRRSTAARMWSGAR
jgi:hypothetical protein